MVPKAWIKAPLEAPTRKMKITKAGKTKITKAADSCLQVDIKILRHILLRVGLKEWRQWLLELYGKEVYRLG